MDPAEISLFLSETLAGRYRPTRHLASGGFAGIFEATDQHEKITVAAKILQVRHSVDPAAVREFQDEVAMLRRLVGCDCVIDLLDDGAHTVSLSHPLSGGVIPITSQFAILELAAGSLADLLLIGATMNWVDRLKLYRDVVKGIHQLHVNRLVHRDIKAENVLVLDTPPKAKVADLGRARDTTVAPRLPLDEYLVGRGDLRFAPPECLWLQGTDEGDDHARSDLYLLGSLLFEIALGVGITSIVANDPFAVINRIAALPPPQRSASWRASIPQLRDAARPAYETFAASLPTPIRRGATDLLRTLTNPDPGERLPLGRGGSSAAPSVWDLQWLLTRVDSIRRAIDPSVRKSYLGARPHRASHARPRGR